MKTLNQILNNKVEPLLTVSEDTPISEACWYFEEYQVGSFLVEEESRIVGIFTERDITRVLAMGLDPSDTTVSEVMNESGVVVAEGRETTADALRVMAQSHIHHLPVVNGGDVIGIVSMRDLVVAQHGVANRRPHMLADDACPSCGVRAVDGHSSEHEVGDHHSPPRTHKHAPMQMIRASNG